MGNALIRDTASHPVVTVTRKQSKFYCTYKYTRYGDILINPPTYSKCEGARVCAFYASSVVDNDDDDDYELLDVKAAFVRVKVNNTFSNSQRKRATRESSRVRLHYGEFCALRASTLPPPPNHPRPSILVRCAFGRASVSE